MNSTNGQTTSRIISIYDYPEHLNPFYEEDNHNKIRFWTVGRKKSRSNSFSLSGIRNAMTLRSFRGRKDLKSSSQQLADPEEPTLRSRANHLPRSTQSVPSVPEDVSPTRYVYGGSVTPTPQPRFHNRSQATTPDDKSGSRLSVNSVCEQPGRPPRAHRKKRRAPPPPILSHNFTVSEPDIKADDEALRVELKIIEDTKEVCRPSVEVTTATKNPDTELKEEKNTVELKIVEETRDRSDSIKLCTNTSPTRDANAENDDSERRTNPLASTTEMAEDKSMESPKDSADGVADQETKAVKNIESPRKEIANANEDTGATPIITKTSEMTITIEEDVTIIPKQEISTTEITISETADTPVQPPTPKTRTILSSPRKGEASEKVNGNSAYSNGISEDKSNFEGDMEAELLADMEEIDKSTHQIKEWLQELDGTNDSVQMSPRENNKDDTNNNRVPPWSHRQFYRSTSTVENGKHRAEIANVQLDSSLEIISPTCK